MGTMKKFIKLLIAFILLFIFVSVMSYLFARSTYKPITKYTIETKSPTIELQEIKATSINGYLLGTVKNNTLGTIPTLNIKVDFYGKTETYLGTEYFSLGNFKQNETKEFRMNFRFNNIESCKISLTQEEIPKKEFTPQERADAKQFLLVTLLVGLPLWAYFMI